MVPEMSLKYPHLLKIRFQIESTVDCYQSVRSISIFSQKQRMEFHDRCTTIDSHLGSFEQEFKHFDLVTAEL